jgi:DNA-directed RNA polymerase specialized sigma subunit
MSNYIDNKKFEKLIWNYKKNPRKYEKEFTETLDLLISTIIHSFSFKMEFDDAKQDCFLLILKVLKNFDKTKGPAFNYFTTVILNNLRAIYTKDKKYTKSIDNYISYMMKLQDERD